VITPMQLPCCNTYWLQEGEDNRLVEHGCQGTMSVRDDFLVYVCDTCRAQCGSLVHHLCDTDVPA